MAAKTKDWKHAPAKERAPKIIQLLAQEHDPTCALHYNNTFELLISTILSAQCTDERVNKVTPVLFEKYPDPASLAQAQPEDVEEIIRSTGFYRQKTKSILSVSGAMVDQFNGQVPQTMEELTKLPGIGRKTANVVLGTVYRMPAIMVDTHVKRVANRLMLTENSNPDKIEKDLIEIIPEEERTDFSHRMIWHGRRVCTAKKPKCPECTLAPYCPSEGLVRITTITVG